MKKSLYCILILLILAGCTAGTPVKQEVAVDTLGKLEESEKEGTEDIDAFEEAPDPEQQADEFLKFIFDNVEQFWKGMFAKSEVTYETPGLNLTDGPLDTPCGKANASAEGPFYCQFDKTIYFSSDFRRVFSRALKVPGDFVLAYAMAHEFGHHVQGQLGFLEEEARLATRRNANELSVRIELQADCFAGVWANSTYKQKILEPGDINEAQAGAAAIGDDMLSPGSSPEDWNHGPARERRSWFTFGYLTGDPSRCTSFPGKPGDQDEVEESNEDNRAEAAEQIQDKFAAINAKDCEDNTNRSRKEPVATISCLFGAGEISADYDMWSSKTEADGFANHIVNTFGAESEQPWGGEGPALGRRFEFKNEDAAFVAWTYTDTPFTGIAIRVDGNSQALSEWWLSGGRALRS